MYDGLVITILDNCYYNLRQLLLQFTTGVIIQDIITIHDRTHVQRFQDSNERTDNLTSMSRLAKNEHFGKGQAQALCRFLCQKARCSAILVKCCGRLRMFSVLVFFFVPLLSTRKNRST